jgi:hypothetical protein
VKDAKIVHQATQAIDDINRFVQKTYDCTTDALIDDNGIVFPTQSHEKPFEQWKLADWIQDMKVWPGLPEELGLKKFKIGLQKLADYKSAQYKALATQMEYHLLHQRELESQIYAEPLIYAMPQVKLMLASHHYITHDFWPRLGYLWKPLCPDADFLWGLFEYSLCYKSFRSRLECGRESMKAFQAKLNNTLNIRQAWLEDPWKPKKKLQSSAISDLVEKTARDANRTPWIKTLNDIKEDPARHLYKLLFIQSEKYIFSEPQGDTLIEPYRDYAVHAWNRYQEEGSLSRRYGFWYLESLDYEPMWSEKVGRPPKPKPTQPKTKSQRPRGPAIGSKRKAM